MNIDVKRKYVPCQLDVVEFKVERGYATSPMGVFDQDAENALLWKMAADHNGEYKNEQYVEQIWGWADSQNNLPGSNQ